MRIHPSIFVTSLALLLLRAIGAKAEAPSVFLLDGAHLAEMRQSVLQRPQDFEAPLKAIRSDADQALREGPWSVMDKKHIPPSGDKHDYFSVGPYWWPNLSKADGLPYIRRDGEVNPERYEYDNVGLKNTVSAVEKLARTWYFTNEAKYAKHAALLLQTWFLDPATKMNPHLQYGQAIPGRTQGRGIGIIDTAKLIYLVDAVGLLRSSDAWSESDHRKLQAWFLAYLQWLMTSSHGKAEASTKNNHAVWYDAQVASFALFVDDKATARRVLEQAGPRRIATQIEPDGRMPYELARTKSFSYTHMNLRGFLHLARLAEHVDVDLWGFRSADGRSIEAALDWLEPFVAGRTKWEYKQISSFDPSSAVLLYRRAARRFDKPAYRKLGSAVIDPVESLLWPKP
jgi:hypothetical protein